MKIVRSLNLKDMPAPHMEISGPPCMTRPDALFEVICRRRSDARSNSTIARKLSMGGGPTALILDNGALPTDRQLQLLAHEYGVPLGFDLQPGAVGTANLYEGLDRSVLCKDGADLRDMPKRGKKDTGGSTVSGQRYAIDRKTVGAPIRKAPAPAEPTPAPAQGSDAEIVDAVVRMLQRGAAADRDLADLRRSLDAAIADADAQRVRADAAEKRLSEVQGLMTRIRMAASMPTQADNDDGLARMAG